LGAHPATFNKNLCGRTLTLSLVFEDT